MWPAGRTLPWPVVDDKLNYCGLKFYVIKFICALK